ncbi:cyclic nucleotide-binding domain-containing protein [Ktedonospora formicarum]|nr:cyclic nucleotide-binding domain-containing protein [Ktedonospora formicarum]
MQQKPSALPLIGVLHRSNIVPLTESEVRFEIDMCIGCDRCMRACPLPLSSQVNIADLNLATISDEIAPHVVRFTQECVMCGSCVPVCPVNNHRDLLMLSLKQRLGIAWDRHVDMARVLEYLPSGWDLARLLARLREQPMFVNPHQVPDNYLKHMLVSSKLLTLVPGSPIIQERTYGREIYFILDGRFVISTLGPHGEDMPVAMLGRGEFAGERGMLTGQQRGATVRARTAATVLEVPEQVIQRMMEVVPSVRDYFESLNDIRSIEAILQRMSLFQGVAKPDLHWLAGKMQFRTYERNAQLFTASEQHQPARETLHIILDGFVKVARVASGTIPGEMHERIIAYRQHGDYFAGGLDMLGDGKAVTATAINRVRVAEMKREDLLIILSRYPEVNQRFLHRLQEYRVMADAAQTFIGSRDLLQRTTSQVLAEAGARAGLRALVGGGVVEGTEVLVIDLDKCVHCDKCEEACERRHGHSRMNRKGMVIGNISVATACRHCQDPVCLLCSRAGIARMSSGEVYITESCIGCGICAERCPYDNISIISLEEEKDSTPSTWSRFMRFFTQGMGKEYGKRQLPMVNQMAAPGPLASHDGHGAIAEIRKKLAIKCDLCAGYSNQACVQACPTGAAFRVQPTQFFGTTEDILQQRTS